MKIHFLPEPTSESLGQLIKQVVADPEARSVLVLACDADNLQAEVLDPILQGCAKPVFGGIFPQILHGRKKMDHGALVIGMYCAVNCGVVRGLSDPRTGFAEGILDLFNAEDPTQQTMFVFVDGLGRRITDLVDALFNSLGLLPNYIGGGAGSLSFQQKPCLISSQGLIQDGAVLALADMESGIGVAHGWTPASKALKVTEADRNMVISLNGEPAFEVYREIVEAHSGRSFSEESFFDLAQSYPLGIVKQNAEMVVRDPIMVDDGKLICMGEVAEGSQVHILTGDVASLVSGAIRARERAEAEITGPGMNRVMLLVDCISRVLFLKKDFERELAAVDAGLPLVGALTLGEIANTGDSYLEFYNKTSVIGIVHDCPD